VGSFSARETANTLADSLKRGGFGGVRIIEADVAGKHYFRVRVSSGSDRGEAAALAERLVKEQKLPAQVFPAIP
jgi:cell division protein FtsN